MMKEEFMNMKKLYHYTKFDTAIKILESHSLRFVFIKVSYLHYYYTIYAI